jgi:hypothetical protein
VRHELCPEQHHDDDHHIAERHYDYAQDHDDAVRVEDNDHTTSSPSPPCYELVDSHDHYPPVDDHHDAFVAHRHRQHDHAATAIATIRRRLPRER